MLPHDFTHFDSLPAVPMQTCPRGVPSQPAASSTFPPPHPPSTLTRTPHIPKLGLPAQIAGLSIKSGNGVLLKCGREAVNSCKAIVDAIKDGLKMSKASPGTCALPHMQPHISHRKAQDYFTGKHALVHVRCRSLTPPHFPSDCVALLTSREETAELMKMKSYVDLIIPRGSNEFVQYVMQVINPFEIITPKRRSGPTFWRKMALPETRDSMHKVPQGMSLGHADVHVPLILY